jgi:predicted ester cyclase
MAAVENKDVVRSFITEVLSGGQLDRIDELLAPDYVNRAFGADLPAFKELLAGLTATLPERRFDLEELIAEGDAVVARFTFEMRDEGGKAVAVRGLTYYRVVDGKIVEDDPITTPELTRALGPDHEATMRRLYELISAGDIDGFGEHMADDFVEHEDLPGLEPGKDGVKQMFRMYRAAFPDLRLEAEDVLANGDTVVARARATGTHQGEFMGLPPTGNRIDVPLIDIIRFGDDGLAVEHWGVLDALGMMQQLGAIPAPAAA